MYTIRVTGTDWWEKRIYYMSHDGIEKEGAFPALKKLNKAFTDTLTFLFEPGKGGPGVEYRHGDKGNYLRGLHSLVTPSMLKIVEGVQKGGRQIREGGKPGSWGDLVFWAERKLGLSVETHEAQEFANVFSKKPRIGGENSPIAREYPGGAGKFMFPEWIVKVKNQKDIEQCSRTMETMIVRYLR